MNNPLSEDFFIKINQSIEEANKKQTAIIKAELESVKNSIKEEIYKRKELEEKHEIFKNKYEKLEKSLVVIFGLEHNTEEKLIDFVIRTLNTLLELNISSSDINDIFTIGKRPQEKPIIVKFVSYLKKRELMQNCSKLKEINKNRAIKISIAEDLSPNEQNIQKTLRKHLNEAKSRKVHAYIKGEQLYLNGEAYTAEELGRNNDNSGDINYIIDVKDNQRDEMNIRETNGTPPTPATKNKRRELEEEEEENKRQIENLTKKVKFATCIGTQIRTSARPQDREEQKVGNS